MRLIAFYLPIQSSAVSWKTPLADRFLERVLTAEQRQKCIPLAGWLEILPSARITLEVYFPCRSQCKSLQCHLGKINFWLQTEPRNHSDWENALALHSEFAIKGRRPLFCDFAQVQFALRPVLIGWDAEQAPQLGPAACKCQNEDYISATDFPLHRFRSFMREVYRHTR